MLSDFHGRLPEWDLSSLYNDIKDKNIDKDLSSCEALADEIVQKYSTLDFRYIDEDNLLNLIIANEKLLEMAVKLSTFAYLNLATKSNDNDIQCFYSRIYERQSIVMSKVAFLKYKIFDIDDIHFDDLFTNSVKILKYKPYFDDIRKHKSHVMSQEVDKYSIEKSVISNSIVKYYDSILSNIVIKYKNQNINLSAAMHIMQSDNNRKNRILLGSLVNQKLGENIPAFVFILNSIVKNKAIDDRWKNYNNPVDSEILANDITPNILNQMVSTVTQNYNSTVHRYYRLKARLLGLKKLDYVDRNAPLNLPIDDIKYSFDDAKKIILDAFYNFSTEFGECGKWFFDNHRIDAPIAAGKRSGAFCSCVRPFIMLNFAGTLDDVTTLAHELGHAIQMKLSYEKYGVLLSDSSLVLAEIPSTFAETIVLERILSSITDQNMALYIITKKIEHAINSISRQTAFHLFEKGVHDLAKNKELVQSDIENLWIDITSKQLGSSVKMDKRYCNYWAYISHFFHHPFYVHSYAFADIATYSLMYIQKNNSNNFYDRYKSFITDITVNNYANSLKNFDIDVNEDSFWQFGMDYISQLIDKAEAIGKALRVKFTLV